MEFVRKFSILVLEVGEIIEFAEFWEQRVFAASLLWKRRFSIFKGNIVGCAIPRAESSTGDRYSRRKLWRAGLCSDNARGGFFH
jgi:hypothetical protein